MGVKRRAREGGVYFGKIFSQKSTAYMKKCSNFVTNKVCDGNC
jgi:hypothetical protein